MKAGGASAVAILLLFTFTTLQVLAGEDLYWEGENEGVNEFLEVNEDSGLTSHLKRFKRQFSFFNNLFSSPETTTSTTPSPALSDDEDTEVEGSGQPSIDKEPEPREKTLTVTFVVIQPYQNEYSNRDSQQFQTFAKSLADEVNQLYDTLPGTQRASLIRIQSRIPDNFSCKVTLEIVTTGYDDTERISYILRDHIRTHRALGSVAVSDADFSATVADPRYSLDACAADEFRCNDGHCIPTTAKCDRFKDCDDGSDEENCPVVKTTTDYTTEREEETQPTVDWLPWSTSAERRVQETTTPVADVTTTSQPEPEDPEYFSCPAEEIRCDDTRCISADKRCDGIPDCSDGKDEAECEYCDTGDFRCNNGKCIEGHRKCNRIVDCPEQEDEQNCECREDEFKCENDGSCIEQRKVCDGHYHCSDNSDEANCACSSDQWQCDYGSCIKRSKRCDGRVDCPTDRSDERNCFARNGYFRCNSGKLIAESLRCNRRYDCPPGDYSDEHNCPCGERDFRCDNGFCIPAYKRCDRTHDCQDGSDERDCTYGTVCMASQHTCSSGQCVSAEAVCNGTAECLDSSDEKNCPCKRDQFTCHDGTCINIARICDGHRDCSDGRDELNCGTQTRTCPPELFTCSATSSRPCATRCDALVECDDGEDEEDCDTQACSQTCDDGTKCLTDDQICNRVTDCDDGTDETLCENCDRADDYRCNNGDCININLRCNNIMECTDGSDEMNCNQTMIPTSQGCNEIQFKCRDGSCIDLQFYCDDNFDCNDESDEENCPWYVSRASRSPMPDQQCRESEFTCYDGRCIPHARRCDNIYDCSDFSDEQNCVHSDPSAPCDGDSWQCASGQCIASSKYCDGVSDCVDSTDEVNCPTTRPWTTTAYPQFQPYSTPSPYIPPPVTSRPFYTTTTYPFRPFTTPYPFNERCDNNQWRCENGPCIDTFRRCDGHVDCPYDSSDEFDCPPDTPVALKLTVYPDAQKIRNGGDVVFSCRDEGLERARVKWVRDGGRPLKSGSTDINGRLEMNQVTQYDAGTYICQAERYLNYPGSEVKVQLNVGPATVVQSPPFQSCEAYQATCNDGSCISKSSVCDGKVDCADGSDEDSCNYNGVCEPNQFQCKNHKCVLKTWLCDNEDDCGDGSDEENCGVSSPDLLCLSVEFTCGSGNQCIPKSFHCDGQRDCTDGTDEVGCAAVFVTKPPTPNNVRLNPGDTLRLVCEAVGVPTPLISWRRNWGHVPAKCTSTSIEGVGNLLCTNMLPEDSGAYSCEAMNNKGTNIPTPDAIVYVNRTSVCPPGYFNSEARTESECIRCFCFGESVQCRSADLFTYNMPTPLGDGGTRLVGVKFGYNDEPQIDNQPVDRYYFEPHTPDRNGAAITKLANFTPSWSSSNVHPYLALPETYNRNQLTSYGGHIKYKLKPHSPRYNSNERLPTIIIKGKYETLVYQNRRENAPETYIEARLTPENWQKATSRGLIPASREDIMMALDNVDMILLRADFNNAGVFITEFAMESAQHINVGLGVANLVEECSCPPGYEGLSCQKCASGFVREKSGPWLGNCIREQKPCPPGTYGDPNSGLACKPCPCPLTNRENQFARTCSLASDGDVICDCPAGFGGRHCEYCERGYIGNPAIPGDSCRPQPASNCNPVGTLRQLLPDECQCKEQVTGRYCDQCKDDSYFLSEDFRHGCALCFCTGVSQMCRSSNLRRKTTAIRFNTPQIVNQVRIYSSDPLGAGSAIKYNAPVETQLIPQLVRNEISVTVFERSKPSIYYWSLPASFSGDKVTSYGGFLRYTLRYIPPGVQSSTNNAPDVQLISDNHLTFHYFGNFVPSSDGTLSATVQFLEKGWHRSDGVEISSREQFLLALADVKTILIKATYSGNSELATLESASIETAEPNGDGPPALHVEQCVCPVGYKGTSCEDCAPGYTRSSSGIYLEHCEPCECNGHSKMCHPETGVCMDCQDNTYGEECELCRPGYTMNQYGQCIASYDVTTKKPATCNCDPRGAQSGGCDANGFCYCKQNVEGEYCEVCRPGTFGLEADNPMGCMECYCSGVTSDCHEASHYARIPLPAPILGDNYGGYTLTDLNAEQVINDQFVPAPNESELLYIFSFPPNNDLYWSLPVIPGNRVLSYGGTISITQSFKSRYPEESSPGNDVVLVGDSQSIVWRNPTPIRSDESLSYQVPLRKEGWTILNTAQPASRSDFMRVLKNLKRVLVRATLVESISSTAIADVYMDIADERYEQGATAATGIEICMCPEGYSGTSCETCQPSYYRDQYDRCAKCKCNGHECQLGPYDEVICNCRPPYTGSDCSILGLVMELHPTIYQDEDPDSFYRKVSLICKYRAPQPLTIKFYFEGNEMKPLKYANESKLYLHGWHGEHVMETVWDTRHRGQIFECHTVTERGSTLGLLSTSLNEPGSNREEAKNLRMPTCHLLIPVMLHCGDSSKSNDTRPPPPAEPTVVVRINSPTITLKEVGSSVNFTCYAHSRNTRSRLPITWSKKNGYLPNGRYQVDLRSGVLLITNIQLSDSGTYICQTSDGVSTGEAIATLQVPGNQMTLPTVEINPYINEFYEGDRVELQCIAGGNPTPRINWQRGADRPLPLNVEVFENYLIIPSVKEEDAGEYRCIAQNAAGSTDRTAVVTVRPRPSWPNRDRLSVTPQASTVNEGQSTRLVCTGTINVPAGSIDWVRQDGTALLPNVRSDNGVLYIDYARRDNQGVYICQASSSDAAAVPILVTIIPLAPVTPLETTNITVSVDRLKIPTGGSGVVDCNPEGYPIPLIKWSKHSDEFGPGVSQRENSLIINNAQESDQGYYICEGTVNGVGKARTYVFVEIEKREPPRLEIWPQGEQPVNLGGQAELHCRVVGGFPEPDVTWARSGGRPLSPHVQIQPQNVLKFERIEVNDEGQYICSATNVAGTDSASSIIKVRSPPEILIKPSSYIQAVQGDSVTVECRGNGYPEPLVSIKTREDERELVSPAPGIAFLRINSVSERDEKTYVCVATSVAGTIEEQFVITVDRGDGGLGGFFDGDGSGAEPYPPSSNQEPSNLIAFEGQTRQIGCDAPEGTDVEWRRTDRPLQPNALHNGSLLIIYNVSRDDTGDYECTVIDRYTNEVQQARLIRLRVVTEPKITLNPKTQTVLPGQSPTVQCIVEGDDNIEITWLPIDRPLSSRAVIRGATLIFHQIEVEDAGHYKCVARNRYTNTSASADAEVIVSDNDRGTLESHDNEQFAHVGAAVHLSCNVTQPNLHTHWTKDDRPLPRSIRQKDDGSLFIRLSQKSDSGLYKCIIQDDYGRQTSNYINLHIEGVECLESQFRCQDDSSCVEVDLLCDGFSDCNDNSDEDNCLLRDKRLLDTLAESFRTLGPREESPALISINQPRKLVKVGDNIDVMCRATSRGVSVNWERYGSNQQRQYIDARTYGDGSVLYLRGVVLADAGIYRCTGIDAYGRTSYEDFNLEVQPVQTNQPSYLDSPNSVYTAKPGDIVDLPCLHDLQEPVFIEWKREYTPLPAEINMNKPNLHIERVSETDAGTYICKVSNSRASVEARAILRVVGIVPQFEGESWVSLPKLKDAYRQFDIEISFKPRDQNGLILYNSQNKGRTGKYVALQLVDGVPQFIMESSGTGAIAVSGDRPLQLNTWHTIRVSRTSSRVTMDVDNTGPFTMESSEPWGILELYEPLYIGGIPDSNQLPVELAGASGFIGCVSMLILGREEKNIIVDALEKHNIKNCDTCAPNRCLNNGICLEARNERGYMCLCSAGFAGQDCERTGQACQPGLCAPGKCINTADGYKCSCPIGYTGKHCENKQNIEYPAFTGSAFLAIKPPTTSRFLRMSMKIKASSPVTDGIIMYCAENARGFGGFMSLAVRDEKLEFRYLGDGSDPVVLTANRTLPANEWTDVHISRVGPAISLKVNVINQYMQNLTSPRTDLHLETPMFVGGVDDSVVLNNGTGVSGGFSGCIKDVTVHGQNVDIVNSSIQSANVQECSNYERGDIPEIQSICSQCRNRGYCSTPDQTSCTCPSGFTGQYCEHRVSWRAPPVTNPCDQNPCHNGGSCRSDFSKSLNYSCDCPLNFGGTNCQMELKLSQSVGFAGNGYLTLPGKLLRYDSNENVIIALAFYTTTDGVLLYQKEDHAPVNYGDYILIRVHRGRLVFDWDFGTGGVGPSSITIDDVYVTNGERHQLVVRLLPDNTVMVTVDNDHMRIAKSAGLSNRLDSAARIYLGGIPQPYNVQRYPGLSGCVEQVEFMDSNRGIDLQQHAIGGRNTQPCRASTI